MILIDLLLLDSFTQSGRPSECVRYGVRRGARKIRSG